MSLYQGLRCCYCCFHSLLERNDEEEDEKKKKSFVSGFSRSSIDIALSLTF